MKALASPPCRGTQAQELASSCPRSRANGWHSRDPNPGLPRPMPNPALGHLLSQRLKIKPETVISVLEMLPPLKRHGYCHCCPPPSHSSQPGELLLPFCLLASCLSVPKCITGPTPAHSPSPGNKDRVFLRGGKEVRGAHQPHCPEEGWGLPGKGLYPVALSPSVPPGTRPWTWLFPCK